MQKYIDTYNMLIYLKYVLFYLKNMILNFIFVLHSYKNEFAYIYLVMRLKKVRW